MVWTRLDKGRLDLGELDWGGLERTTADFATQLATQWDLNAQKVYNTRLGWTKVD
jgi:hypothetical protein